MPHMAAIISMHNKIALLNRANPRRTTPPCNCRNKANCPLEEKCRESSIIYKATQKSNGTARHKYGCSETEFKTRFNNHKQSLVYRHKRNATTKLSKRLFGMPKTQEQILASNGASRQKLVHITREQNRATSVLPRNPLFYNPTSPQHSIKNQSLTANAATKTSSNRKVLLHSFAYQM